MLSISSLPVEIVATIVSFCTLRTACNLSLTNSSLHQLIRIIIRKTYNRFDLLDQECDFSSLKYLIDSRASIETLILDQKSIWRTPVENPVHKSTSLSDEKVLAISCEKLTSLNYLVMRGCRDLSDAGFSKLLSAHMSNLRILSKKFILQYIHFRSVTRI